MSKDSLQDMFSELRNAEPKITFDSTSRRFLKSQNVGFFGISFALFFRKWNYLNWIIMTTSIITISAITVFFLQSPEKSDNALTSQEIVQQNNTETTQEVEEAIEIEYFTADSQLIQRVRKDKSHQFKNKLEPLPIKRGIPTTNPEILEPAYIPTDTSAVNPKKRCFKVYKNMDDTELPPIEAAAKAAGLDFRYKVIVWKGKVKRLEYRIKWTGEDGKYCTYHGTLKGKFTACIGWYEDADGNATGLLD